MTDRKNIALIYSILYSGHVALITLQDDLLWKADRGAHTQLVLLDLSVAFDTIDHGILLDRLSDMEFGVRLAPVLPRGPSPEIAT